MSSWTKETLDEAVTLDAFPEEAATNSVFVRQQGHAECSDDQASTSLFAGDLGTLPVDTRVVLVQLLLGPLLDAQRHTKLWSVLLRDERVVRSRLHELFLELIVDHEQQVAFTRQVIDPDVDPPILLRKASLTFIQSALLLYLREQLVQAELRDARAVVSRDDMLEHLSVFEPEGNRDQAKFAKQTANAVEKAKDLNLLRKLRGSEDRYEVSPTLKLLFPAEEIQALSRTYDALRVAGGNLRRSSITCELGDQEDNP